MILCMPTVGQKVRVLDGQEWKFRLFSERRNYKAWEFYGGEDGFAQLQQRKSWFDDYVITDRDAYYKYRDEHGHDPERKHLPVTLPAGTLLTIDRIYLRKGAGDYDSITFILNKPKGVKGPMIRFWVKLEDVNCGLLELLPVEEEPSKPAKPAREDTQWG